MSKQAGQSLTASASASDKVEEPEQGQGNDTTSMIEKVKIHLLVYYLPFFYGAITRLPFIYFVIHLRSQFKLSWEEIGFFVGSYQAARVVVSFATIFVPKISHFVGTGLGLVGSIVVLVMSNDDKLSFLLGTIAIGFSESLASSQTLLKNLSSINKDIDLIARKIKVQYAAVMFGVTFAFLLGGVVYDAHGIDGIAVFGIIMSACELLSLVLYVLLDTFFTDSPTSDEGIDASSPDTSSSHVHENDTPPTLGTDDNVQNNGCTESNDIESAGAPEETQFGSHEIKPVLDSFSNSAIGANFINYVFVNQIRRIMCISISKVITFGVESITIGYNLAISPVFIVEEFEKSATVVGIILAAGGAVGTVFSIYATLSKKGQSVMKSYFPSPYNLFTALGGIAVSVFTATIPSYPVYIVGLIFLMAFNDLGAVILNEIQGTITTSKAYSSIGPMGQTVRRSFNVVTAITAPVLFGVFPRLPYLVAGSITAVWLMVLVVVITRRTKKSDAKISNDRTLRDSVVNAFRRMSFGKREILKRQHKKGKLVSTRMKSTIKEENEEDPNEEVESSGE